MRIELDPALAGGLSTESAARRATFAERFGIRAIRGCRVHELFGDNGRPVDDFVSAQVQRSRENRPRIVRRQRHVSVLMDPNQYLLDTSGRPKGQTAGAVYGSFNVVLRLERRHTALIPMLETLRDAISLDATLPDWLQDLVLGYGDRNGAHYTNVSGDMRSVHLGRAFADWNHLKRSFPDWRLRAAGDGLDSSNAESKPPFVLTLPRGMFAAVDGEHDGDAATATGTKRIAADDHDAVLVRAAAPRAAGDAVVYAAPRFTPTQAAAIVSGALKGLTIIAGAPGSGKTTIAAQVAASVFASSPSQRTLVVAPTRANLVALLSKLIQLGVPERHVVSLSHGFDELRADTDEALSKLGRVNHLLARRKMLLARVNKLAAALDIPGAHGNTCETASYFFSSHVAPRWASFKSDTARSSAASEIRERFPFSAFFAPQALADTGTPQAARDAADKLYDEIAQLFADIAETQALELLRARRERTDFIVAKQARVIGVDARDLPLKYNELSRLGADCTTVIIDNAHAVQDAESFLALLVGGSAARAGRGSASARPALERVVLAGDPLQPPTLVRSIALRTYSRLGQSLFERLIRLGVTAVEMPEQGRMRESLAGLCRSLYPGIQTLEATRTATVMQRANPGFAFESQFVDVQDFMGQGETEPRPGFFQNLGEAEYVVAVFQYMRLIGYPASKIAILTPYRGQRELIIDVLAQRCSWNPIFGTPRSIATLDEFHDGPVDVVLMSLVRTRTAGAVADPRQLAAGVLSARLGVYVFGRRAAFAGLQGPLSDLAERPDRLWLRMGEKHGERMSREAGDSGVASPSDATSAGGKAVRMEGVEHMGRFVHQMAQEQVAWLQKAAQSQRRSGSARQRGKAGQARKPLAGKAPATEDIEMGTGDAANKTGDMASAGEEDEGSDNDDDDDTVESSEEASGSDDNDDGADGGGAEGDDVAADDADIDADE
nr:hypothetical protein HK105_003691 [Polyrhizophydium stewartii]